MQISVLFWKELDKERITAHVFNVTCARNMKLIAKGPYDALGHVSSLNRLHQTKISKQFFM